MDGSLGGPRCRLEGLEGSIGVAVHSQNLMGVVLQVVYLQRLPSSVCSQFDFQKENTNLYWETFGF